MEAGTTDSIMIRLFRFAKERFARGEITKEQFEQITKDLEEYLKEFGGGNQMIEIKKTLEVSASPEKVWSLVGDLEHEQRYWSSLRDVKILKTIDDHTVEREAKIKRGPMGEAKSFQTLSLDAPQKTSTLSMTKGPMLGTRKIALIEVDGSKTRIEASWQFGAERNSLVRSGICQRQHLRGDRASARNDCKRGGAIQ